MAEPFFHKFTLPLEKLRLPRHLDEIRLSHDNVQTSSKGLCKKFNPCDIIFTRRSLQAE